MVGRGNETLHLEGPQGVVRVPMYGTHRAWYPEGPWSLVFSPSGIPSIF